MKKIRRRKCLHCAELYHPDPRTRDRQCFCSAQECKQASKRWRQKRWLQKASNKDYFKGPDQVARVQDWREENPGYWKKAPLAEDALQDDSQPQVVDDQQDSYSLIFHALQDDCLAQTVVLVGLISYLTGSALQDDIVVSFLKVQALGQQILGKGPGIQPKGKPHAQNTSTPRSPAPSASAVQLD
jgi:hypothetical protein